MSVWVTPMMAAKRAVKAPMTAMKVSVGVLPASISGYMRMIR